MNNNILDGIKILYVEDDDNIRKIFTKFLERKAKDVQVSTNGEEGYTKFLEFEPDIIVSDINMPKLNGLEMSKKIKKIKKDIPIILTSAHNDTEYYAEAISLGVNHYLSKPVNAQELLNAIELYAKNLLFEREQKKQERILQSVINSDRNIIVAFNSKEIIFSNKSFLHFYSVQTNGDFLSQYSHIFDTFLKDEHVLSKDMINDGSSFEDLLIKTKDEKRVVKIHNVGLNIPRTFYVNISTLFYETKERDEDIYLLNLTDITSMSEQKIEIEGKAFHDNLTNIYNRYKLEDIFEYELKQFKRYKREFCFSILDIDFFKKFNDTYGHLIGDEILVAISNILEKNTREADVIARWGGEEFVILLPNTKLKDAVIIIEKLRQNIEDFNHETAGGVTASFGLTRINETDDSISVFKRADEALYEAKGCGRNLVITKDDIMMKNGED